MSAEGHRDACTGFPRVVAINTSSGGIPKRPVRAARIETSGIAGDGHDHDKHNTPMQALCLIDTVTLGALCREGYPLEPGAIGENVTIEGLDVNALQIGDRLRFSGGVQIEITKHRKPCYVLDAIDPTLKKALVGRAGVYGRILTTGRMRPGETIEVQRVASPTSTSTG